MGIKKGINNVANIFFGNRRILNIFQGDRQVYEYFNGEIIVNNVIQDNPFGVSGCDFQYYDGYAIQPFGFRFIGGDSGKSEGGAILNAQIDFTKYRQLIITSSSSWNNGAVLYIGSNDKGTLVNGTYTIDVSNISGLQNVRLYKYAYNPFIDDIRVSYFKLVR